MIPFCATTTLLLLYDGFGCCIMPADMVVYVVYLLCWWWRIGCDGTVLIVWNQLQGGSLFLCGVWCLTGFGGWVDGLFGLGE